MDGMGNVDGLPQPLAGWARHLERLQWSALILDANWTLSWVSTSLRSFIRVDDDADLGFGLNLVEAWTTREEWLQTATPESQLRLFQELGPLWARAMSDSGRDLREFLGEQFMPLVEQLTPATELPFLWSSAFDYLDPQDPELPPYQVNFCSIRVNDERGETAGSVLIFFIDVNPNLMTLLVRGDQAMYERMAQLVEPGPREAAVLFCDLHRSGALSRKMSTAAYFKLVRRLWTAIDGVVAERKGIVGKHAGDGAAAFFLVDDLGSRSATAAAAIDAARRIHDVSGDVFGEVLDEPCRMKVGLHWGTSLYMGQLVPRSRLDVTALGDEVNEAARIEECARPHESLASKHLVEKLGADDAAGLGLDLEKLKYEILGERDGASRKAIEDAGGISVTAV